MFGATGNGDASAKAIRAETDAFERAIQAAAESGATLYLGGPSKTYAIDRIRVVGDIQSLTIDGGGATIQANQSAVFQFGVSSGNSLINNLTIENIVFRQDGFFSRNVRQKKVGVSASKGHRALPRNGRYIVLWGVRESRISNNVFHKVGNGAILLGLHVQDMLIENNTFIGRDSSTTNRAIWINGADSEDYIENPQDYETLALEIEPVLNDLSVPQRIVISNNQLIDQKYGIYLINTRHIDVLDNNIEIDGGRCVAVNNYSPFTSVIGGECNSMRVGTGVLVTKYSHDVVIKGVTFSGDFGGNRAVQVSFLAEAVIAENTFSALGSRDIQVDMGGMAHIYKNDFSKSSNVDGVHIYISTLDPNVVSGGHPEVGSEALEVSGSIIKNNIFSNRPVITRLDQRVATNGNAIAMNETVMSGNTILGRGQYNPSTGQVVFSVIQAENPTQPRRVKYRYLGNLSDAPLTLAMLRRDLSVDFNQPILDLESTLEIKTTALHEAGSNFEFLSGDYNMDGTDDVYAIKKSDTGSGFTEVHVLDGADDFASWLLHKATILGQTDDSYSFLLGDYNQDGVEDLYALKTSNTDSAMMEVRVLDGATSFTSYLRYGSSGMSAELASQDYKVLLGDFAFADSEADGADDIYVIKRKGTASGKMELTVLDGASDFFEVSLQSHALPVSVDDGLRNDFLLFDENQDDRLDLVQIPRGETGTDSVELHIVDGSAFIEYFNPRTVTSLPEVSHEFVFLHGSHAHDTPLTITYLQPKLLVTEMQAYLYAPKVTIHRYEHRYERFVW